MQVTILDKYSQALSSVVNVDKVMRELIRELDSQFVASVNEKKIIEACRNHAIRGILETSPLVKYALDEAKPWGEYIFGDAHMLRYLYQVADNLYIPELESASNLGKVITRHLASCSAALGVVERRDHVAAILNKMENSKILAVACGSLPELEHIQLSNTNTLTALDIDLLTIEGIAKKYQSFLNIHPIKGNILLMRPNPNLESDFVYSLGLLDYFSEDRAIKLLTHMYRFVKKGGSLLIANFNYHEYMHFMHVFMKWSLVYRTREDMLALASNFPNAEYTLTLEKNEAIWLLEIKKPL